MLESELETLLALEPTEERVELAKVELDAVALLAEREIAALLADANRESDDVVGELEPEDVAMAVKDAPLLEKEPVEDEGLADEEVTLLGDPSARLYDRSGCAS